MTGTISIKGVSEETAISFMDAIKGISKASGISFAPDQEPVTPPVGTPLPLHSRICFEGDSITRGSNGPTHVEFDLMFSQGRFYAPVGYNEAVGGETARQMAQPAEIAQVLATNPKVVVFLAGTNDLGETSDDVPTIFANIRTCVTAYRQAGAQVVNICVLPRNDPKWQGLGPQREADRQALNAMIRAQNDVLVVDLESVFDPATMTTNNTAQDNGLHPNYLGAITIAKGVAPVLNSLIVADTPIAHSFDASNLMLAADNPQLTGTTGTHQIDPPATGIITGPVAAGWVLETNGNFTVDVSQVTLNGQDAQRIVVSGNNDTKGRAVILRNTVTYSGVAGELYETWWDFQLAAGSQNLETIGCSSDTTQMPVLPFPVNGLIALQVIPGDELSGVLRPPNTAPLAAADTSTTVQVSLGFQVGACAADITLASPFFGKVPADR
ncbi:SGNH/GDSL hydrolase family protein [Bradyrhizobium cenepequi]|uniref:SGNH/GDSL hydrolase family protein n=1 Tax=Bradyrhizobium cenepequi TaxID=2821403 RepID=UPI001CE27ECB|nr:SGNH/GDSL hydrolase family protein [Bradyrhizobium cenepequi]MCA6108141.1 SGNH/GDSL hydrolase family protein [Bradyrhizobium cenepequi]